MAKLEKVKVTLKKLISIDDRLKQAVVTADDVNEAIDDWKKTQKGEFKNILEASTEDD